MFLLITGSYDGTSDRIVTAYGPGVFRFNHDLWRDYTISFAPEGWRISNAHNGMTITSETVSTAFWWKPFIAPSEEDQYVQEEVKYIFRDIYGWCVDKGIARGNHFTYHSVFGKMTILGKAKAYFKIPQTGVFVGSLETDKFKPDETVVKSLATARTNDGNILITTQADLGSLDPSYPWYVQEKIDSDWDVTVFYCNERSFAFERSRADLHGLDWRMHQSSDPFKKEWSPISLGDDVKRRIVALSHDIGITFGRFDFLSDKETGELIFLEVNAHGQWVFLDYFSEYGLMDCFIDWVKGGSRRDGRRP